MQTYRTYKPSAHDRAGLNLPDRQDWFVAPCGTNRDADRATESNFAEQASALGETNSDDYEEHEFGHWACGWFKIVLVRPGSEAEKIARKLEERLEDYPLLNEDDFGEREVGALPSYEQIAGQWGDRSE